MTRGRNIKLVLAYDGTAYHGWQRQDRLETIQGLCEDRIRIMTGEQVTLYGAGRTDAGVHALAQVANFFTRSTIPCQGFQYGLNSLLPRDIRVFAAEEVDQDFHSRYKAVGKSYFYRIANTEVQMPTDRLYSVLVRGHLDVERVRSCLAALEGRHDFSSFAAAGSIPFPEAGKGARREIFKTMVCHEQPPASCLRVEISGDGFLRHMVRNIVGTLIEVGQGKRSSEDFLALLAARDRTKAGPTAPASGLFLEKVFYSRSANP